MKRPIGLLALPKLTILVIICVVILQPQRMVAGLTLDEYLYLPLVANDQPPITKIAFISERDGNREIYAINSDGTNLTRLTNNSVEDFDHSWSPDGSQIVYRSDQDGNSEIYKVNVDGLNPTRLTNNISNESHPAWSPDGQKIAFRTDRHGSSNYEIYLMNSNGTGEKRLTNNSTHDSFPTWSPDGTRVAFVTRGEINTIQADGTNQLQVTSAADVFVYDIDWSPDGTRFAFRGEVNFNQEIFIVNVDGSGLTNLTNSPGVDLTPKWSPNGAMLAYTCNFKLCVINPDGSNFKELADNVDQHPTWSPDRNQIVFSSSRDGDTELYTIGSDGVRITRLTDFFGVDYRPVWQP